MSKAASEPGDIVGSILNNKYQVLERLSQGGMGVVYKARHLTLDTPVALKVLLKPEEEEAQERFLSEARLASKIRHPNTVYIADFGVLDDGRAFLEMEFLAGRTLAAELRKGPIDPQRASHIAMQIARGLQAVHEKGIIHRDMKPDNVFLLEQDGSSDFVKIVDFGIAKVARRGDTPDSGKRAKQASNPSAPPTEQLGKPADGFTQSGTVMGTPGYMSPEQISGEKLDGRVDQYALGCMLYEMLAGAPVFDAPNSMALMAKHMTVPPPSLRQKYPSAGISKSLDALVLRLLAKDPSERLRSMREVEAALQDEINALVRARGGRARLSPDSIPRSQPSIGRSRVVIAAVAGLLVLAVLSTVAYRLLRTPSDAGGIKSRELAALRERALVVLRADVASGAPELRVSALSALGQSRDEALRPDLEAALRSDGAPLRAAAAAALGLLGDRRAVPTLGGVLEKTGQAGSDQAQVLVAAATALRQLGDARGQRFLEQTLDSQDQETQFRAALAFCEQGPKDAQRILRSYSLRDGLPDGTRLSVLGCLAKAGDDAALTRLRTLLSEAGPLELRLAAAVKLAQVGDSDGLKFLRDLAKKRGREQLIAAQELALLDEADGIDLFRQTIGNRDAQALTRQLAARGLAAIGEAGDARLLGLLLDENADRALTQAAAAAIVQIAGRDPGLLSLQSLLWAKASLSDADSQVRQSAAEILGNTLGSGAVSLLSTMLKDGDVHVRRSVVMALGKQQDASASLLLRDALRDGDRTVRSEALRALQRMADRAGKPGAAPSVDQLLTQLRDSLLGLGERGSPQEKVQAAGLLLRLGDETQRQRLRDWLRSDDVDQRRWAIELLPQSALSKDDLAPLLRDTSPDVRSLAARRLGALGDARALPILRELAAAGGPDSVAAAALLRRLSPDPVGAENATEPTSDPGSVLAKLLQDPDAAKRLDAVALLGSLPTSSAKPLLLQAVRDRDPLVRRMVVASISDLADADPAGVAALLPVLKRLTTDPDAGVYSRAAALYARLAAQSAKAGPPAILTSPRTDAGDPGTASGSEKPAGTDPEHTGPDSAPPAAGSGQVVVEGPTGVQFSIDKRPWQAVSERPISVEAGPHTLNFLNGEKPIVVVAGQTLRVKIPISQVEQLARAGLESYARSDFKKAQRQLEKAISLCSRDRLRAAACASLSFELYFRLGQIHEQQKEWPEAMTEFQRVLALASQVRGRGDIKSGTQEAVARLSPRLGQVVVPKRSKRSCSEDTIWMRPGTHSIKIDSKFEQIEVKAREVVRVGKCQ